MPELKTLFVRTRGTLYGPLSEKDLLSSLKKGLIPFSAWIHSDGKWALLAEIEALRVQHPEFETRPMENPAAGESEDGASRAALTALEKNSAPSRGEAPLGSATISAEPVWFFVRDKKKFGPYSAAELVGQLQRKLLDPATFVWRPGFSTWQRMSAVSEFSRESMRRLASDAKSDADSVDILVKRKTKRVPYEVEIVAHDNTRAIEGRSMVIGEGGLFLATERPKNPTLKMGARLKLHFREGKAPSFNAVAEIVSIVRGEVSGYCLRFVALSDGDRRKIAKLIKEIT